MEGTGPAAGYALRRLRGSGDPLLRETLELRARLIRRDYRDDDREIAYWLDHFDGRGRDRLYCLALLSGERVAGHAQFLHLGESRILFFDYLVLDPAHRRADVLVSFIDQVRALILADGLEVGVSAAEVTCEEEGARPTREGLTVLHYLAWFGFGIADLPYRQPPLRKDSPPEGIPALLMLRMEGEEREVPAEALDRIVRAIYFDHYVAWSEPMVEDPVSYARRVEELYGAFRRELAGRATVALRGVEALPRRP